MNKIICILFALIILGCGGNSEKADIKSYDGPQTFAWDFSKPKTLVYSYTQNIEFQNQMAQTGESIKSGIIGSGLLKVRVKENLKANLSITDLQIQMIQYNREGEPTDTSYDTAPDMVVPNMSANGDFVVENTELVFDVIFPLPSISLTIGAEEIKDMMIPFNARGSVLPVNGKRKLKFQGFETIQERNCAVLKADINISELQIPDELKMKINFLSKGEGIYYFDLQDQIFIGCDINLGMNVEIDVKDNPNEYMNMISGNVFKTRLLRVEE